MNVLLMLGVLRLLVITTPLLSISKHTMTVFFAESLNGDAFSDEMKQEAIEHLKANFGKIDVLVYSIAAPRRIHPRTGDTHNSVLKPIGESYTGKTIDLNDETVVPVTIEPANDREISDTIAVMGGEDLEIWVETLADAELLAPEVTVVAYTYIGSALTWPILPRWDYRQSKR